MQKSWPGTDAQSESVSSGDRNLIQGMLLFIPQLTDLKDFSTFLTLQTSLGNVCMVEGTGKSWGGIFGPLGMDSGNTEFKEGGDFKSPYGSPIGKKANNQFLFPLKRIFVGLILDTIFKNIKNTLLLEKTEILLTLF